MKLNSNRCHSCPDQFELLERFPPDLPRLHPILQSTHSFPPQFPSTYLLLCNTVYSLRSSRTSLAMATASRREGSPAEGTEPEPSGTTVTGGNKPLHRFLRGQPKSVGIVLMFLGSSLFVFGIPLKKDDLDSSADMYCSFWLGILYFICGVLYMQAEREPTKKIVTASLALSVIAILGTVFAVIDFIKAMTNVSVSFYFDYLHVLQYERENDSTAISDAKEHYMQICNLEAVFLVHSLVAGVILITMSAFARMALRSSRTKMVVVMRNLPTTE